MVNAQRDFRFVLEHEDNDNVWIFEAVLEPINHPINVTPDARSFGAIPLVDAPIVSVKSAEVKPPTQTESEVNIATLIIGGIMLGSICFGVGYLVGTAQHQPCNFEVKQ